MTEFAEDNPDAIAAEKEEHSEKKSKNNTNHMYNCNSNDGADDMVENKVNDNSSVNDRDEEVEDERMRFDVCVKQKSVLILLITFQRLCLIQPRALPSFDGVKNEVTVKGLKELQKLGKSTDDGGKCRHPEKPYVEKRAQYHVVPQLPFTKEKDAAIQKYIVSPQSIETTKKYEKIIANKKETLKDYMIDKNGEATRGNINMELIFKARQAGTLTAEAKLCFLSLDSAAANNDNNSPKDKEDDPWIQIDKVCC